jgi:GNAT superfamily N-acetyltransferase
MRLRTATVADAGALATLAAEQLAEHGLLFEETDLGRVVKDALTAGESGFWLIAFAPEDAAIGFAYLPLFWSLEHGGRVAWLEEMYVLPDHRGQGVGAALVREACAQAAALGCKAVDLEVDDSHARAARLYEREGFRQLNRQRWVLKLA